MKIYLIYASIDTSVYDYEIKFITPNKPVFQKEGNKMKGLYAWTTKKKLLEEFVEARNGAGIYMYLKKEVSKEEYFEFKSDYNLLELKSYGYFIGYNDKHEKEYVNVVSTKNEFITITEDGIEYVQEEITDIVVGLSPYPCFNEKIMKACSLVGLLTQCQLFYGNDDDVDYISYQESFGLSVGSAIIHANDFGNELCLLIFLFQYMFEGCGRRG